MYIQLPPQLRHTSCNNCMQNPGRRTVKMLKLCGLIIFLINLIGCVSTGLPTSAERMEIKEGEKAIVLLRVELTIEDQQPYEPFGYYNLDDNITFGLGTFDTGGKPERLGRLRFLSSESRRAGWTYFLLSPGTYYLTFYPPRRTDALTYLSRVEYWNENNPLWRFDLSPGQKFVYAGTLRLTGMSEGSLFEGRIMNSIRYDETSVVDERQTAFELLSDYFPELGAGHVSLIRRNEGPIILRSPLPADSE